MQEQIQKIISSPWAAGIGIPALIWIFGKFAESSWYQNLRKAYGKSVFSIFAMISNIGETKLGKALWNPIERVIADFLIFGGEQAGAGLRSDNIEKLEQQVDRLKDVGSTHRVEAVEAAIGVIKHKTVILPAEPADKEP